MRLVFWQSGVRSALWKGRRAGWRLKDGCKDPNRAPEIGEGESQLAKSSNPVHTHLPSVTKLAARKEWGQMAIH